MASNRRRRAVAWNRMALCAWRGSFCQITCRLIKERVGNVSSRVVMSWRRIVGAKEWKVFTLELFVLLFEALMTEAGGEYNVALWKASIAF